MSTVKKIASRIYSATEKSPIAVEYVNGKLRSYFAATVSAPAERTERFGENGKYQGVVMLMPHRYQDNLLGVFHGKTGVESFKKMCAEYGLK